MPSYKEPHHFNTDEKYVTIPDRRSYERLFSNANSKHKAIGEASTGYLYSKAAVPNIENYNPDSRYIVCLRNPIEMAYSLHEHQYFDGVEHIADFQTAWEMQELRLPGKPSRSSRIDPRRLAYGAVCSLGEQMGRLYAIVPRERVLTIVLDDLKANAGEQYRRVLDFLDLENDGRTEFPVLNTAKERRSRWLFHSVQFIGDVKRILGISWGMGILDSLHQKNTLYRPRQQLSESMRNTLNKYFKEDIARLGFYLGRDFSHWMQP